MPTRQKFIAFARVLFVFLGVLLISCSPSDQSGQQASRSESAQVSADADRRDMGGKLFQYLGLSGGMDAPEWSSDEDRAMRRGENYRRDGGSGMGVDDLRRRFENAFADTTTGAFNDYMGRHILDHATPSADAAPGVRLGLGALGIALSNAQRQAAGGAGRAFDALLAGEDTGGLFDGAMDEFQMGMANDVINRGLDGLRGLPSGVFQNLEGEFILRKDQLPEYALTTIQPLYESDDLRHTFFAQAALRAQDEDRTGNLGLAYRHMTEDRRFLYGVNSFFDYEWPNSHGRMSLGVDAATSLLSFNLNRYWPVTGWRDISGGYQERGMAGWDSGVTGRLESLPDIQLAARGYLWERDGAQGNLTGAEAGLDYSPVPAVRLGFRAGRDTDEDLTLTSTLSFRWLFGIDAKDQLKKSTYALDDVSTRRYDKVQRENRILKQTRQNPSLTARVTATAGANTAQLPGGGLASLRAGMQLPYGSRVAVANTAGAIVEIAFGNGATLIIGQDSLVQLTAREVTLASGIMRFISGGSDVTVNVPGGTVTLTGTDIDARSDGNRTTVRVRDGSIRVDGVNGTENAVIGETVLIDLGTPSQLPFADPEAALHRAEAHAKLDRAGQQVVTQAAAAPYVTGTPVISSFTGTGFDITLPFSKPVTVTGAPEVTFTINGITRTAAYSAGSGSVALTFSYVAVFGDIGQSSLVMDMLAPEGSIVSAADAGQRATLSILPETVNLPGTITGGGGGPVPTVDSITPDGIATAADPIVFTVVFSEAVTGFDVTDPIVMNGTVAAVAPVTATQWTVDVTPAGDGAVSLLVPANSAVSTLGVGNAASATVNVTSDRTPPAGYAVAFADAAITTANAASASVDITGAEVGATLAYSITSSGGGAAVTGSAVVPAAATTISMLDLSGLGDGTLTVSLTLTDALGNAGAAVTATVVKSTAGAAATAMAGPAADYYTDGENLDFTLTFGVSVTVTGAPRLALDMGGSTVYADYVSGSGTTSLLFRHVVAVPDAASPLAYAATTIDLNGGAIVETAGANPVNADFSGVAASLAGVIVDTTAPSGYAITFDGPVNGANATTAGLTMTGLEAGGSYAVSVSSDGGGAPVAASGAVSAATMPLTLDLSGLSDGTLEASLVVTDAAGNAGAAVTGGAAKSTTAPAATVSPPAALTNADPIVFTIVFTEAVTGFTAGDLTVVNGSAAAPTTADNITWQVDVTPAGDGVVSVQVQAASVVNGLGTPNVASNVGSTTSDRTAPSGQAVAFDTSVVNAATATAAGITLSGLEMPATYSLSVTSSGGGAAVNDSGAVSGASMPRTLDLSGLGDGTLTAVLVVTDAAGNVAVGVNTTATKTTTAPALTAMTAPANGSYNQGDVLSFTVTWNQPVTVSGAPRIQLDMNGTPVYADYASGTGTATLTFTTTVAAGQTATPLAFGATAVGLNGGTVASTASGNPAALSFAGVAPVLASIFVDTTAPSLTGITPPNDRVYVTGEAISFAVAFTETMAVTGTPRLELTYGATTSYATYVSGAGSATLIFSYVAQAGDLAPAGLVVASSIDLNGGTLADVAGNPPAALTFAAPDLSGVQINVPSCAGGTVALGDSFLDGYCAGRVTIAGNNFDLIVAPSGCGYEAAGTATTAPAGFFTPACAGTDSVTKTWSDATGTVEGGSSVEDGITNTINVINDLTYDNPAIAYCYRLDVNSRTDWYLPSRNELEVLHQNLGSFGLQGFAAGVYWASTETDANSANTYDMSGGLGTDTKTGANYVRCVRRITPPQIALNPNPASGREGVAYSATIAATGGGGSLTFTLVSGSLPPGLTLDAMTGVISGTPTLAGIYPGLVVRASDAYGQSETNPFTIDITGLPRCNSGTVVTGTAYAGGLCASTTTIGAETYDIVVTPSNCGYEPAGSSTTKPLAPFTPTCTGAADTATKRWGSSTSFNEGGGSLTDGVGNSLQVLYDGQAQNAAAAYCYQMVYGGYDDWYLPSRDELSSLYDNMRVNGVGGFAGTTYISSTQTATNANAIVDLSNGVLSTQNKTSASRVRCIRRVGAPLRIVQPQTVIPAGAENIAYSVTFTASGGAGGATFSVAAGSLPPGLTLDPATGVLSGTPTLAGTYAGIVIRATDTALATADTPAQSITITGLPRCGGGTVAAGDPYGGGICAGEMPNGGSPYDLVATVSRCAQEPSGNSASEATADFTPACTGAVDNLTKSWANATGTSEPAASTTDGLVNTQGLLGDGRRQNAASAYCYHLVHGGFDDWYLPATQELDALFFNLSENGLGGFAGANYAASTQTSTTQNRYRSFLTGATGNSTKTTAQNVRCVRRVNPAFPLVMQTSITAADGAEGLAYSQPIPATSSIGPLTFALQAGSLPPGLSLDAGTGYITGTPTTAGTYTGIVISATDGATMQQTVPFDITILAVDACSAGTVPAGDPYAGGICVGTVTIAAQTYDLVATVSNCGYEGGGSTTTEPANPFTPTCNGATDTITKRWTLGGSLDENAASTTDGIGNTLQVMNDARRDNPAAGYCENMISGGENDWYLPSRDEMVQLYDNLSSKGLGGFANTTYWTSTQTSTANAAVVQSVTGVVSSTAKTSTSTPRVRCVRRVDSPLAIGNQPLGLEANEGVAYSFRLRAQGGAGAHTFSVTAGALPAGLSLDGATGVISGTPTVPGTESGIVVSVTDGVTTVATAPFDILVYTRARCAGSVLAGDAAGGGICAGNVTIGAGLPFDLILSPSGCGVEPSGSSTTKPMATFTPTCSGGTDTLNKRWGSTTSANEGATLTDDGLANTLQLLSDGQSQNAAAAYCFHLSVNGYDDWYLPAELELNAIYDNVGRWQLGGLAYGQSYYSSTEQSAANARRQTFDNLGSMSNVAKTTSTVRIRCVRRN